MRYLEYFSLEEFSNLVTKYKQISFFGHVYMELVTRAWQRSLVSQHASWVSQAHARNCQHSLLMNVVKINSQKPEKKEIKI